MNTPYVLSAWTPLNTHVNGSQAIPGTVVRFIEGARFFDGRTPVPAVLVVPAMGWQVIFPHGTNAPIEGRLAAPSAAIARAYADDYLNSRGDTGPGIGPLPSRYPPLRNRENVMVPMKNPSQFDRGVMVEGAKCECGYVGEDIVSRYDACPGCGGVSILGLDQFRRFGIT